MIYILLFVTLGMIYTYGDFLHRKIIDVRKRISEYKKMLWINGGVGTCNSDS